MTLRVSSASVGAPTAAMLCLHRSAEDLARLVDGFDPVSCSFSEFLFGSSALRGAEDECFIEGALFHHGGGAGAAGAGGGAGGMAPKSATLIAQASDTLRAKTGTAKRAAERYAFLLDTTLLLCKPIAGGRASAGAEFKLKERPLRLRKIELVDREDGDGLCFFAVLL